ncbi:lipoprotein-releasing system permease protein/zinc transport system substrate-binding protein [Breznakibacter xylanolyticus]|uniref:Lipoprotein-releasing system permease protein/zinc transport system substrate-binding protein n=1 Tax=Breznakibacter xylanolyticus TaxID=990 RepID=A0A2W7NUS0_9BACT|nr:FtsX-like permease family protein [Breznakibacter xylanolyticus]MBN2742599.1 ABC transporter permease [Marinilabiliaceae bacterium]PZX14972.1 lipoprotein-releasing system permease protein/zinc transport system substrate-binding protein [Breznakibacter xylanolyticus]
MSRSLPVRIALRYLFARKSQNIISIISLITVVGVMTGTIGLLGVLSVFNGLHQLIGSLFGAFDPDLRIDPRQGKVFHLDSIPYQQLVTTPGVEAVSQVLIDQALFKSGKRQVPGMLMGVDDQFNRVTTIDSIMYEGTFRLENAHTELGIPGYLLAEQLSVSTNFVSPVSIYMPRRNAQINMMNPESGFKTGYVMAGGVFAVKQVDYDSQYLLSSIRQARWLLDYDSLTVSSLFVRVTPGHDVEGVQRELQQVAGVGLTVKTKEEQHEAFFKMMKIEKLMAYLILSFIMVIAAFNVIGSLSMLIYEKKESIFTLRSMGASLGLVTRVFLLEGWFISLSGAVAGLALGSALIAVQQHFGIIKFQGDSFVTDAYPVVLKLRDVGLVFATVSTIGLLAAWYPVTVIVKKYYSASKEE